jgi:alpha-ketoglutarate-dependent taurine dioxygenase
MSRKAIETIAIESFDSFIQDLPKYVDLFKKQAIIVFRGFKFSREQQLTITRIFGDHMNWYPNSNTPIETFWPYEENHSKSMDTWGRHDVAKDEYLLMWHIEHMGHKNPAIGATWNMEKFSCERDAGSTLFVNISDVYDTFSEEDTSFLKKCEVSAIQYWDKPKSEKQQPATHDAVELYEPSGRHTLRLNAVFKYGEDSFYLERFEGRKPSEEENERFYELALKFTKLVHNDEDLQQIHLWQENDLLVVDLFLMAHAVFGGFKPSERSFYGLWAHRRLGSKFD